MATTGKPRGTLRQTYEIAGGVIELRIATMDNLSPEDMADFGAIAAACEEFAAKRPSEFDNIALSLEGDD